MNDTAPHAQTSTLDEIPAHRDLTVTPHHPVEETEKVDYFATYNSIRAGEKLQLLKALGIAERDIAQTGTAQLVVVVWKHHQNTRGVAKVADLLNLTEGELYTELGLTESEYVDQVNAFVEGAASKS